MRLWVAVVAGLVVLLIAAPANATPPPKVLDFGDSGQTVTLVPGQHLRIELSVCYSCGYSWETRRAPSRRVLRRLKQRTSGSCKDPCTGGSAVTKFRYAARARGTTKLRLAYVPPGTSTPEQTFRLRIKVQ